MKTMNELILQYYDSLSSSISRRSDIQGPNDTIFLSTNLSVSHAYKYLFSSVLSFCVRNGRMRVSQVWYTDPVVPLSLNVLTETLNPEYHVSRMTSLTLDGTLGNELQITSECPSTLFLPTYSTICSDLAILIHSNSWGKLLSGLLMIPQVRTRTRLERT
jgi:hypothetical protein